MSVKEQTIFGKRGRTNPLIVAALVVGSLTAGRTGAEERGPMRGASGAELFKTYCASCHGVDAAGNGPVAPRLRQAPPDLTLLSKRNGDAFPEARVRRIIDGRDVESHGDRDMPVWGDPFRKGVDRSERMVVDRIDAIVQFLATIQRHEAQ